jgi:hypothetical protein
MTLANRAGRAGKFPVKRHYGRRAQAQRTLRLRPRARVLRRSQGSDSVSVTERASGAWCVR